MTNFSSYLSRWTDNVSPETKNTVYRCIEEHGPISVGEAVDILELEWSLVNKVFRGLKASGYIKRDIPTSKHGHPTRWRAAI